MVRGVAAVKTKALDGERTSDVPVRVKTRRNVGDGSEEAGVKGAVRFEAEKMSEKVTAGVRYRAQIQSVACQSACDQYPV